MKKWELLHLALNNSKSEEGRRQLLGQNKKCSRQGVWVIKCEFCVEGNSKGRLISEMSSEFSCSWIF